jgi:hypothetical protein
VPRHGERYGDPRGQRPCARSKTPCTGTGRSVEGVLSDGHPYSDSRKWPSDKPGTLQLVARLLLSGCRTIGPSSASACEPYRVLIVEALIQSKNARGRRSCLRSPSSERRQQGARIARWNSSASARCRGTLSRTPRAPGENPASLESVKAKNFTLATAFCRAPSVGRMADMTGALLYLPTPTSRC